MTAQFLNLFLKTCRFKHFYWTSEIIAKKFWKKSWWFHWIISDTITRILYFILTLQVNTWNRTTAMWGLCVLTYLVSWTYFVQSTHSPLSEEDYETASLLLWLFKWNIHSRDVFEWDCPFSFITNEINTKAKPAY